MDMMKVPKAPTVSHTSMFTGDLIGDIGETSHLAARVTPLVLLPFWSNVKLRCICCRLGTVDAPHGLSVLLFFWALR